ncbi:MAG: hypothetical protein EON54_18975 [Alcaligenaceae bacterium]|nr:MAG: hypothetical protein EON54_18975 [Alcaligenaceae bacterium]
MAEPQVIQCASACTVTVVHEISIPPFNLSVMEGSQIAFAICAVWAVGFLIREIGRAIFLGGSTEKE